MEPLRWKYEISIDVDETAENARSKGFSVKNLEGQSRRIGALYPLGQIEIKGGKFEHLDVQLILVGPRVTQLYKKGTQNLDEVDHILNDIVVFASGETSRFGKEARIEICTSSMLKERHKLIMKILRLKEERRRESERESAYIFANFSGEELQRRTNESLQKEINQAEHLIQKMKEMGIKEAVEKEKRLNEIKANLKRWETERASARSEIELSKILLRQEREYYKQKYDDLLRG